MKRIKKGFTIIELVIVIAVIGVLTAVLVPVFINLANKANEAADDSLVKNLNTALKMEEAERGSKPYNMQMAVDDLRTQGYILENLVSKSGKDLLWQKSSNEFVINKGNDYAGNDFWKISNDLPSFDNQKYSYYAGLNFNKTSTSNNLKYGFDAGDVAGIESLNYVGTGEGNSVIIRTNSAVTSLNVNAPTDTVIHYGPAGNVVISAVAGSSYHEHGEVSFLEVANGRVALESASEVTQLHLNATNGNFNNITIAKPANKEMPILSRDKVDIPAEGKLVVALQDGTTDPTSTKEYVWLTAVGIYEQVTLSNSSSQAGNNFAATSETADAGKKETAQQIANNITANVESSEYTLKATTTDGGVTWNYVLSSETKADITDNVTVAVVANVATVSVNSVAQPTAEENGLTPQEKEYIKDEIVHEAVVEEIEEDEKYIARIDTVGYESLEDAIAHAQVDNVIELIKNDPSTQNINVDKRLTINMNGNTFGGTIVVETTGTDAVTVVGQANVDAVIKFGDRYFNAFVTANNGTVTLMKDITMSQIYKHDYSGTAKNWGIDLNGHTITLTNNNSEGGVYVGSYYGTNHTLSFSNGNLVFTGTSSSAVAMEVYGNLNLNNVNVTSSCGTAIKTEAGYWDGPAHVTITGGSIVSEGKGLDLQAYKSGTTVKQSTAVLTNVTISAKNEGVKSNGASCTIESCSISSTNSHAVSTFNSSSGSNPSQVIISGNSSIAASSAHAINCTSGTLQISGNTELTGTVYVQSSAMTISGGVYHGNFSLGGSGQLTIAGGTYNGNLINVTQAGRLLVIGETQFEELVTYSITGSNGSYEVVAQ